MYLNYSFSERSSLFILPTVPYLYYHGVGNPSAPSSRVGSSSRASVGRAHLMRVARYIARCDDEHGPSRWRRAPSLSSFDRHKTGIVQTSVSINPTHIQDVLLIIAREASPNNYLAVRL